ncbi:MAG: hypothetical protein ACLTYN_09100 [Dysosmobacter welbionis]
MPPHLVEGPHDGRSRLCRPQGRRIPGGLPSTAITRKRLRINSARAPEFMPWEMRASR